MWKRLMQMGILAVVLAMVGTVVGLAILSLMARRPQNLGVIDGKLAPCPDTPNCVSSQAADADHRIEPLAFHGSAADAWARLVLIVTDMPRCEIATLDDAYLHAEVASALFRFTDDLECMLDADRGLIHLRSASRVGRSDLGVNRKRVEAIHAAWKKRLP